MNQLYILTQNEKLHFISLNSCFVSIRTIIEISSRITIMQCLFKSQVYSSVNARKMCSLRCTYSGTGGSLTALKPTRKHLQLSTDNKKLIYRYKKPSYWRAQDGVYGK